MKKMIVLAIILSTSIAFPDNFHLNLAKGQHFITTITNKQSMIRDINGQQTQVDNSSEFTLSFEVQNATESTYVIAMRYSHISISSRGVGWEYRYDSNATGGSGHQDSKRMNIFYRNLLDQPFTLTINRNTGTISSMTGWEELKLKLMKSVKLGTKADRQKAIGMILSPIENGIRNNGPVTPFPGIIGKEIRKGNQWQSQSTLSSFSGLLLQTCYHVLDVSSSRVKLSVASSLSTSPTAPPIGSGPSRVQYQLTGTQKGTIIIDRKTGWLVHTVSDQQLDGTLTVIEMGIKTPIELTGHTEITSGIPPKPQQK